MRQGFFAEPVYTETEVFMNSFAEKLSKKTKYPSNLLLCLLKEEIAGYFKTGKLPAKNILEERFKGTALVFKNGEYSIFTGKDVDEIERALLKQDMGGLVSGTVAFPGKAVGIVRIVFDPSNPGTFNEGDILVTGMTRPEFLALMKKAGAIVTDAGGMLCHAAITARELKKVTIIGTEKATKVFKPGDRIEVDASNGSRGIAKRL